jgi:hypothetical protein
MMKKHDKHAELIKKDHRYTRGGALKQYVTRSYKTTAMDEFNMWWTNHSPFYWNFDVYLPPML